MVDDAQVLMNKVNVDEDARGEGAARTNEVLQIIIFNLSKT